MAVNRSLTTISALLIVISILLATPYMVLADEGQEGIHGLEVEVNGYHVILSNESEWAKGENTIIVILADKMGMPVTNTEVQILIAPKLAEQSEEGHSETEASAHGAETEGHDSMPGMSMSEATEQATPHEAPAPGEEEHIDPISMREAEEHGMYVAETHLEKSGVHEVLVMFHADGEMIEAVFTVAISGTNSKTVLLWSFALINMALIASAGFIKKQSIPVKGVK